MATRQRAVSTPIIVVAGVGGAAAIALLLVNLLGGGGGGDVALPSAAPVAPALTPAPTPEPAQGFEVFEGRDPFRPLVVESAAIAPGASPGASPGAPDGAGVTPAPTGAPVKRIGVQVEVYNVVPQQSATVRVGSRVYEDAVAGQTLASGVVIESIEEVCVNFRRDADTFRLCEGEHLDK